MILKVHVKNLNLWIFLVPFMLYYIMTFYISHIINIPKQYKPKNRNKIFFFLSISLSLYCANFCGNIPQKSLRCADFLGTSLYNSNFQLQAKSLCRQRFPKGEREDRGESHYLYLQPLPAYCIFTVCDFFIVCQSLDTLPTFYLLLNLQISLFSLASWQPPFLSWDHSL